NLAIHAAAALLLFGIVRRTTRSAAIGFASALIWAVHPLQTQAVTYVVQRTESLMGLFLLLTLYAAIRAWDAPARARAWWYGLSSAACAFGMATKQTMVGAPVIVLLWDWLFAPRRRWSLYAALAGTWVIVAVLVILAPRPHSVGQLGGWTPLTYL